MYRFSFNDITYNGELRVLIYFVTRSKFGYRLYSQQPYTKEIL